ncbi:MAG: hypothetical protein DRI95_02560 [Bacteroidetes bacterium]|nr:MAG: hypothetical protein DRI89_00035 [Bacteroidota bacterium]RLD68592.1 MAG: hypothetical protein DRI95_02560 [Bacteroidota bacterium]
MPNSKTANEYNTQLSSITKNAAYAAFGILFMNIMAFLNNVIITRTLGADSYGLFVLVTNVFGFIALFPQLGFGPAIIRYVSNYIGKGENEKAKGTILFSSKLLLITSIVFLAISLLLSNWISEYLFDRPELTPLLNILLLSLPFSVIATVFFSALNGLKLIKYQIAASNIINPLVFFFLINIIFFMGYGLTGLVWVMVFMGVAMAGLSYYFLNIGYFKLNRKLDSIVEKQELLRFATPIYLNQFLNTAIRFAPIFIMGYFLSNTDIGIFNVGFRIAMLVSVSLGAFRLIFSPTISSLYANNKKPLISQLYKTVTKWIFTIALLTFCIIILFTEPILNIFGKEFTSGISVLLLLVFGELINAGVGLVGSIILMSGRSKVVLFNASINFITIVSLSYFLIPDYGIIGAALSYSITVVLLSIIRLIELYYFEKMHPFKFSYIKPLVAGIVAFVLTYFVVNGIDINQYIEMISGMLIFLLLFVFILWALKFDDDDKYIFSLISNKFMRHENDNKPH